MKKFISIGIIIAMPFAARSQGFIVDKEIFNVIATIAVMVLVMIFIFYLIRQIMDYRLKNKVIEKGLAESVIATIFRMSPGQNKLTSVKWFALLSGLGIGFFLVKYTAPIGFHSLGIMSFSLAAAFLGYYFFLKKTGN